MRASLILDYKAVDPLMRLSELFVSVHLVNVFQEYAVIINVL